MRNELKYHTKILQVIMEDNINIKYSLNFIKKGDILEHFKITK